MRVCLCVDRWPTYFPMHGPARYVRTLATELTRLGVAVHVLTPHPSFRQDFTEAGYQVHCRPVGGATVLARLQPGAKESWRLWRALEQLHRASRFDLVEFTNYEGLGAASSALARLPVVVRVHTTAFDTLRLGIGHVALERGYARLERWTASRAAALVTHTVAHRNQVAQDYRVPAERIAVVPHGVAAVLPAVPVDRNPWRVLSVGAATPRKGVELFLQSAARLAPRFPQGRFVWVGKDTATAPGSQLWSEYTARNYPQLSGYVEFVEAEGDPPLAAQYAAAGGYLCTSRYESFGLTLVEAMHAALPVVAPQVAGVSELVRSNETGLLYTPGSVEEITDAIAALWQAPDRARLLGKAGQLWAAREFQPGVMAQRMMQLYAQTCGSHD